MVRRLGQRRVKRLPLKRDSQQVSGNFSFRSQDDQTTRMGVLFDAGS